MRPTNEELELLTQEANQYLKENNKKLFPPAMAGELRESGAKRCSKCSTVKLITDFGSAKSRRDGLHNQCRECASTRFAKYREANQEALNEYRREYYATNELGRLREQLRNGYRRAIRAGNQADWITPEELLTYWNAKGINPLRCYLTGAELTIQNRSLDHVLAISNDGSHTVDNLYPCTLESNLRKRDMSPEDAVTKLTSG